MEEELERETQRLIRAWARHDEERLRDYLVQGVEDPRINVQSILTRHFLLDRLFPGRFEALKTQELRFAVVMNWLLDRASASAGAGSAAPPAVAGTLAALPCEADGVEVPDYGRSLLACSPPGLKTDDEAKATFQGLWARVLARVQAPRFSVLEAACGSANDYRFIDAFGIGRLIDYTGFDLCDKNIRNARAMFPGVRFEVGNVFEIGAPDDAFDLCFVHDLFEHLSIRGMEVGIAEACRVTRQAVCVGFFNMHEGNDHFVKPVADYHRNVLSVGETRAVFERHASAVQVIHIDSFLRSRFGYGGTHNQGAYTFVVTL